MATIIERWGVPVPGKGVPFLLTHLRSPLSLGKLHIVIFLRRKAVSWRNRKKVIEYSNTGHKVSLCQSPLLSLIMRCHPGAREWSAVSKLRYFPTFIYCVRYERCLSCRYEDRRLSQQSAASAPEKINTFLEHLRMNPTDLQVRLLLLTNWKNVRLILMGQRKSTLFLSLVLGHPWRNSLL